MANHSHGSLIASLLYLEDCQRKKLRQLNAPLSEIIEGELGVKKFGKYPTSNKNIID